LEWPRVSEFVIFRCKNPASDERKLDFSSGLCQETWPQSLIHFASDAAWPLWNPMGIRQMGWWNHMVETVVAHCWDVP
jgi:hypothetical protein